MNRGRRGEERGGKETDRCPLTGGDPWETTKAVLAVSLIGNGIGVYV
jgi:hypothetical protein